MTQDTPDTPSMSVALPLPSTERMLRGVRSAVAGIDVAGRPDLKHLAAILDIVVSNLIVREDTTPYAPIYANITALAKAHAAAAGMSAELKSRAAALDESLPKGLSFDAIQQRINMALGCLNDLVRATPDPNTPASRDFLAKAEAAEAAFYAASLRPIVNPEPPTEAAPITKDGFENYLLQTFPGRYRGIGKFQKLVGGFQKETILVDAETPSGNVEHMVIRAEKHDRFVRFTASAITDEFAIVSMMRDRNFPVAEPLWLESDQCKLARRFMVSRRVDGLNATDWLGNSIHFSPALLRSFIETAVRLHHTPIDAAVRATQLAKWLDAPSLKENTLQEIRLWRRQIWMDKAPPSPGFTRLFDWLEANAPEDDGAIRLIHGDFGPHNILIKDDRVQAVLDWEIARLGDPAEDISFFLQCSANSLDREEAITLYQELSGIRLPEYRLRYFDVLSCGKVLLSALSATAMYQATDPALLDWCQMPILWPAAFLSQIEDKIAAAEAARGR